MEVGLGRRRLSISGSEGEGCDDGFQVVSLPFKFVG